MNRFIITTVVAGLAVAIVSGCKDEPKPAATPPAPSGPVPATQPKKDEHANVVSLGTTTVAGLTLAATQDEPVKPGGEGAFDLKITGYPAGGKPKAVRFWVGVETGDGSVKAKAAEETPDNWHTHVEVPKLIPADGKFWAEVEPATGEKFNVSFHLKQ